MSISTLLWQSGGQVGDTGVMGWTDGSAVVTNTVKTAGLVLHHVRIHTGTLALGQAVSLKVDASRRAAESPSQRNASVA